MVAEGIASIVVAPFCLSSFIMVRILQYEERLAKKKKLLWRLYTGLLSDQGEKV